jgi:hypothetical protein
LSKIIIHGFLPGSPSPEGKNYEAAWMNTFNVKNNNMGAYGFSTKLNDLLFYNNDSLIQQ